MKFSESLAKRMRACCETQYALAKALRVEQSTVANWLNDRNKPRLEYIGRLAEHYGCTVDEMEMEVNA